MASGSIRNVSPTSWDGSPPTAKQGLAGDATCARPQKGSSLSAIHEASQHTAVKLFKEELTLMKNLVVFAIDYYMVSHVSRCFLGIPP